ncbi:MAG TPA: carbohydrate ABC transporter permease [Chloroflexota bacterium]|nr:carbohydrate ABC transporter permease [Chloroflexota bacterium]
MRARPIQQTTLTAVLWLLVAAMFYPFYFMVQTSLKDNSQFALQFWLPTFPLHLENYATAFPVIWHYIINSVIVVGCSTAGVIVVATLAAYPLARLSFPGREVIYYGLISLMMLPNILTLVPQFVLIRNLGLIGSYWGVILPYIAAGEILAIFILRGFFASLPEELFEAARIDGASEFQVFLRVALPLVRPAITAIAILQVLINWNDYILPLLVLTDDSVKTLVLGLVQFQTRFVTNYGPQMAGYTIGALPLLVLFSFGMRQFVAGITSGALKL